MIVAVMAVLFGLIEYKLSLAIGLTQGLSAVVAVVAGLCAALLGIGGLPRAGSAPGPRW